MLAASRYTRFVSIVWVTARRASGARCAAASAERESRACRLLVVINLAEQRSFLARIRQAFAAKRSFFRCLRLERRHSLRSCARERRVAAGTSVRPRTSNGQSACLGGRTHVKRACGATRVQAPGAPASQARRECRATLRCGVCSGAGSAPWPPPSSWQGRQGRLACRNDEQARQRAARASLARQSVVEKRRPREERGARAFVVVLLRLLGGLQRLRLAAILADHG